MSLKDRLRLKLKVKTKISLCMAIMLDNPWQSLYSTTVLCDICNWPAFTLEFLSPQVSVTLYACAVKKLLVQSLHEGKNAENMSLNLLA